MLRRSGYAGDFHPMVHRYHCRRWYLLCRRGHCAGGHEGDRSGAPHSVAASNR
jgi:hypothetical protein